MDLDGDCEVIFYMWRIFDEENEIDCSFFCCFFFQWKKKQEKKRMSQRFRAAATAAKLCVKMSSENVSFDNLSSKQLEEIH